LVSFVGSSKATKAGENALVITALASQGQIVGSAAANTTITAGVNDELTLTIDGITSSFKLAAGSYNAASLVAHLQATINGMSAFSKEGVAVSISHKDGVLTITSNRYGSASKVAVGGSGAASLLGAAPVATDGVDVAGTINGVAALGSGQFLTGAAGSNSEGLKIQVTGGNIGPRGSVTFSQGYASQLNTLIGSFLGTEGLIAGRTDGINQSIKDLGNQRDAVSARLASTEARYRKQFTALDSLISSMNTTSSYLTQQLAALANLNKQ
ncbi:MAG: flagellar filament capping protein FliD, partial [Rhodanobacter sp.]